jgi:hypothetical protein
VDRQSQLEATSRNEGLIGQAAAALFGQLAAERETQAGSPGATRREGDEELGACLGGDTRAIVFYGQANLLDIQG